MSNVNDNAVRKTIGLDLGDRFSRFCVLDASGRITLEARVSTTQTGLRRRFQGRKPTRVAIETGTHSPWVEELLIALGHEVLVADARKIRLISSSQRKNDRRDAELLARLARLDIKLLHPVTHRGTQVRRDLTVIRSRAALVEARTKLVNHVRGTVKSLGHRLPSCSTRSFHRKVAGQLPDQLSAILAPVLEIVESLTEKIGALETRIEELCEESYPETKLLRQVQGVGPLSALCFRLTIDQPKRFKEGRQVGAYLGLVPRRDQSGENDPELRITKAGDPMLRTLLIQCSHYIMGPFGRDSDLRRFGLRLASRGGKNARKRAVVAVARKLAVLLRALWVTGEVYEPLRNSSVPDSAVSRGA